MSTVSDRLAAAEVKSPERRLPLEEVQLDALFAAVSDAVYLQDLESCQIIYWSPGAAALFGFDAADILGHPAARLRADKEEFYRSEEESRPELVKSGRWRGAGRFRCADGTVFDGDIALSLLNSAQGRCAVAVVRRQSEQAAAAENRAPSASGHAVRQSEAERTRAEQMIGHLLRNTTRYAVFTTDPEGRIGEWNEEASRLFAYASDEVRGKHLALVWADDAAVGLEQVLQEAQDQGTSRYYQWMKRKDGKRFYARVVVFTLWDDSQVRGFLFFLRDDSREPTVRQLLREKEQMAAIGTAASILAHEIGNPLNGISATVQLLEHCLGRPNLPSAESMLSSVNDLKGEVKRLTALLTEFKNIAGPQRLALGPVDLKRLLQQLVGQIESRSAKQNVEVAVECPAELPLLNGDDDKLRQALMHMLDNALDAMPHGGRLVLKAYLHERSLCLDVIDTGVGIPKNLKVFDLFSSTKPDGIGLGLFLVQQIVLAHDGSITYSSTPGQGTSFHVTFALNPSPDTPGVDFVDF